MFDFCSAAEFSNTGLSACSAPAVSFCFDFRLIGLKSTAAAVLIFVLCLGFTAAVLKIATVIITAVVAAAARILDNHKEF